MTTELWIQIGISGVGAALMGLGVYLGMVKALARLEVKVDALEKRVDRLEAPHFAHADGK